jgi:hypothetical protein
VAARLSRWRPSHLGGAGRLARVGRLAPGALALLAVLLLGACLAPARGPTYPPAGVTPPPASGRTDAARAAVIQALAAAGLQGGAPDRAYVPPEGARFASAPRTVVQVQLPNETSPRFIALYAFDSPAEAAAAAAEQAAHVARGPGKVYFPSDSRFTIRQLDSVVAFFSWSPGNSDPRAMAIETALQMIGTAVPIPA